MCVCVCVCVCVRACVRACVCVCALPTQFITSKAKLSESLFGVSAFIYLRRRFLYGQRLFFVFYDLEELSPLQAVV